MMLLALVLTVVGATSAMGQKIYQAELDKSMFAAWDGVGADAKQVEPTSYTGKEGATVEFSVEMNLYKQLGAGALVFGNTNVYSRWYADLTGTKTITFKGTAGVQLRVLMNRPDAEEGAEDPNGGATVEKNVTIGDNGEVTLDVTDLAFVHLNAIKLGWGSPGGVIKAIVLDGTVKPVTGILSMINNGDAEGTDLSSFPVSFDGPNNGDSAPDKPEIVSGGIDGGKCFKVVSHTEPSESWHTQFYIYSDEVLPKGTKWKLKMAVKGDQNARITTSAQAQPRAWKGGMIDEFGITTEWQNMSWSGEIGVDDFQSIAFDLSNGDEEVPTTDGTGTAKVNRGFVFYFDNIEFGIDLGETSPMNDMVCEFGADVVRVVLDNTNIKSLVEAAGGKTLVFPNDCAVVTLNGKEIPLVSVEGRPDGNLYFFMLEDEAYDKDEVTVAFKNPEDAEHQILFTAGKWEGQAMPEFSGLTCAYADELMEGEIYSYLWAAPQLVEADPEVGSFTLDGNMKEFKVTFNQKVEVKSVEATLGSEKLTPSAADEFSKVVTLTRTGSDELSGVKTLTITKANGEKKNIETKDEYIEVKYSFGPMSTEDKPEVIYLSNFTQEGEGALGEGWIVTADNQAGMQPANSGAGNRLMHDRAGYAADVLYLAQRSAAAGIALYGTEEDHKLTLKGGTTYHLTLKTAQWDAYENKRTLRAQVLTEDAVSAEDGTIIDEEGILGEEFKAVTPEFNNSKEYTAFDVEFKPAEDGNYVIRLVSGNEQGNPGGFGDGNAIADVKVEFIPDVMGIVESEALAAALQKAKETRDNNSDERYAGGAFTALDNLIKEYDGKKMTAPSAYTKATSDLNDAVKALNDHVTLCNNYDKLPNQAFDLYMEKKDSKFNTTEYFTNLKAAVMKYCTITNGTQVDEETGEETTGEMLESFKLFYEDAELTAAYDELSTVIKMASKMLTDGKSNNHTTSGYAALHERLRRGVELLKSLGVSEDEEVIVNAEAELGDNDALAEAIVNRASLEIFKDLASGESQLFATSVDDDTMEETSSSYDLSVFAKNPNIYGPANSVETPGWTKVSGNSYAWSSWSGTDNHTESTPYPEDCSIHAGWHPNPAVISEQTIENLPAGIYTIKIQCSDNNSPVSDGTYGYVKVTDTPEVEEGEDPDPEVNYAGYVTATGEIEGVEVIDGKLTIGFRFGTGSQAFLDDVEIWMTSPISGHDYTKEYQEVLSGVEAAKAAAKVRAIEIYDLNGKRIPAAKKGVVIVKKIMSDGTVKTEKAIR